LIWSGAFLLTAVMAGCGGGGDGGGGGGGGTPPPSVDAAGAVCDSTVSAGCVDLKTAGTYAVLGQSGTTNTGTSKITGNIGTSAAASTATTGFAETMDASNTFATSSQVTGKMYASDYADPTPANLSQAVTDSIAAYSDAAGRTPSDTNGGGDLGGQTVGPGVHLSNGAVAINSDVILTGTATDVFIFQVGSLTQAANTKVVLSGGALAKNVFWQVASGTNIGAGATFEGIIITGSTVAVGTGATVNGRIYAAGPVTLDSTTLTRPGQ
jgi:hypothetical protein